MGYQGRTTRELDCSGNYVFITQHQ